MARGAAFATWWTDHYTRGLPGDVRDRRRAEIESDVFEQRRAGTASDGAVWWRTVRGIPADLAWRRTVRTARPSRVRTTWRVVTQAWFAPLAAIVAVFDLLLAWGVATEPDGKMPGQAVGPLVMASLGVALVAGLWLRWRIRSDVPLPSAAPDSRRTRMLPGVVAVLVLCFGLLTVGVSAGSPVYSFVGLAVVAVTALGIAAALVVRAVRSAAASSRAALADGLIIVGVLPGLAFFWMVVPALVAIAVIAGVAGVGRRVEPT